MLQDGRRVGPPGTPTALETGFGWVLCGNIGETQATVQASTHVMAHSLLVTHTDDLLKRFSEMEETPTTTISQEERDVLQQFEKTHAKTSEGRFVVTLPKKQDSKPLGESRSQAVRRFQILERSLHRRHKFHEVEQIMQEYMSLGQAEQVPDQDLEKDCQEIFYLPIYKASSTSTKVRPVFDASAKTSTGVSLNDTHGGTNGTR